MTEFEKKAEEIRKSAEQAKTEAQAAKAEAAAAKAEAEAVKGELAKKDTELKSAQTQIDNLDKSVKSQAEVIEALKKSIKENPKGFKAAMRAALEEKKTDIQNLLSKAEGQFTVQLKLATTDYTPQSGSQVYGSVLDPGIAAVPVLQNAFLLAFGVKPLTGARVVWREATTAKTVGYVAELANNGNKTTVTFVEKFRRPAKVATYIEISSEAELWFDELVNFCTDEGQRIILEDIDTKVWSGAGDESTKPTEVFGIKAAATAFSGIAKYQNPTIADVISDAIAQVKKNGFSANIALLSYGNEQALKGLKDANDRYLYDQINHTLGQVRIIPTEKLTDDEILIAANNCAEILLGDTYELEFSRKAETDSWRVDFRKLVQTKIKTPWKKGLIYVADIDTAITAITKA